VTITSTRQLPVGALLGASLGLTLELGVFEGLLLGDALKVGDGLGGADGTELDDGTAEGTEEGDTGMIA
jgi:hypothetical protein